MKVETKTLQKMLDKAMKGVVDNKIIPITSLVGLRLEDEVLSITATDRINFIRVLEDKVKGKNMEVTIPAHQFNKLVQRITAKEITIELKDNFLEIKAGSGKYKIELPLEEDSLIQYPEIPEIEESEDGVIDIEKIKSIIDVNKICVAKVDPEHPWLEGYHVSKDSVTTGDGKKAAINSIKLFKEPFLLCKEVIELLTTIDDKEVNYFRDGDQIIFESDNVIIYTIELEDEPEFPNKDIAEFFKEIKDESYCKLPKEDILKVLDRISLFVTEFDQNKITLNFSKAELSIKSKTSSGSEIIKYEKSENVEPFECAVNLEILRNIISVQSKGSFNLYFGDDDCLKFIGENTKHLVALTNDDSDSDDMSVSTEIKISSDVEEQDDLINEEDIPF